MEYHQTFFSCAVLYKINMFESEMFIFLAISWMRQKQMSGNIIALYSSSTHNRGPSFSFCFNYLEIEIKYSFKLKQQRFTMALCSRWSALAMVPLYNISKISFDHHVWNFLVTFLSLFIKSTSCVPLFHPLLDSDWL